jgi:hypothetical protein
MQLASHYFQAGRVESARMMKIARSFWTPCDEIRTPATLRQANQRMRIGTLSNTYPRPENDNTRPERNGCSGFERRVDVDKTILPEAGIVRVEVCQKVDPLKRRQEDISGRAIPAI